MKKLFWISSIICFLAFSSKSNAGQNLIENVIGNMLGKNVAAMWQPISLAEKQCVDKELKKQGSNLNQVISQGVSPQDKRIKGIRKVCQQLTSEVANANSQTSSKQTFNDVIKSGRYLKSTNACSELSAEPTKEFDSLIHIEGNEITGWEWGCSVKQFKIKNQSVDVTLDCGGEGENWTEKTKFSVRGDIVNFGKMSENKNYYLCNLGSDFEERQKVDVQKSIDNYEKNKNASAEIVTEANAVKTEAPNTNGAIATGSTIIGEKVSYFNRCGHQATIIGFSNINSASASATLRLSSDDAFDNCTCDTLEPVLDNITNLACIKEKQIEFGQKTITANCETGFIVNSYAEIRSISGKYSNNEGLKEFEIMDVISNKLLEMATYSNYYPTLEQFALLCPSKICRKDDKYSPSSCRLVR